MTEDLKQHVTKGKAEATLIGVHIGYSLVASGTSSEHHYLKERKENFANMNLIAEAFTVFSETGMTPREMQEMLKEAYEALPFGSATRDKINHALKMYDNLDQH